MYFGFISIVVTLVMLGFLVLIHEFGHFVVAKSFGVRVEQFAIGFGKRLFGYRRGDTDYRVNLLPFGGYVKMSGENPMEGSTGDPAEFMSHPRWQRLLIAIAGPTMNILLAVAIMTGVFMVAHPHEGTPTVARVQANSPAAKAGIEAGDRIVRIGSRQNPTWEQVEAQVGLSPDQALQLEVQRGNEVLVKTLVPVPGGKDGSGQVGFDIEPGTYVISAQANMPAARAGVRDGDEIVAVGGAPLRASHDLVERLQEAHGGAVALQLNRDGHLINLEVTPVQESGGKYVIGVQVGAIERLPFGKALAASVGWNKEYSGLIFQLVGKLIQHRASIKQMAGPIGIGEAAGRAAFEGWLQLLIVTAMISLNLGILNLFPIPIMDGGVMLLLAIEALMRHDISLRVKERIYQAAFVFLVLFAAIVIYNDVVKIVPGS
ncbi:MAG: RIP metalloprotease RseP [Acidobacteria bacterium]|nr:RIP metalloprotease RseP [Acidobacteriota bacterium]